MAHQGIQVVSGEIDEASCSVSLDTFENPYLLVPCGHSFSYEHVKGLRVCPLDRTPIEKMCPNIQLKQITEVSGVPVQGVMELFCVDVSSSMWYSDHFGPLCLVAGDSRLQITKNFIKRMLLFRKVDPTQHVALVTFGTDVSVLCREGRPESLWRLLEPLQPVQERTSLFDAVAGCCNLLSEPQYAKYEKRLYIFTDGGDNNSSLNNKAHFKEIADLTSKKKLKMAKVVFNVGGESNIDKTKQVADGLQATFKNITRNNWQVAADNYCKCECRNREDLLKSLLNGSPVPVRPLVAPVASRVSQQQQQQQQQVPQKV